MDDARKLCSASKKLEESQRLQLIGHHDSRLIYFFTGKGKQSFEEMVYENVWKAGEQFLKGLANHSGKKAHWSCLLYTTPSPPDVEEWRMPASA